MTANLLSDPTAQLSIGASFEYCVNRAKFPSHLDPLNDESVTAQENSQPFKVCRGPVWQEIRARIIKSEIARHSKKDNGFSHVVSRYDGLLNSASWPSCAAMRRTLWESASRSKAEKGRNEGFREELRKGEQQRSLVPDNNCNRQWPRAV